MRGHRHDDKQKPAVSKQAKALNVLTPISVVALVYVGHVMFQHA